MATHNYILMGGHILLLVRVSHDVAGLSHISNTLYTPYSWHSTATDSRSPSLAIATSWLLAFGRAASRFPPPHARKGCTLQVATADVHHAAKLHVSNRPDGDHSHVSHGLDGSHKRNGVDRRLR
jgi:hypothetical protein